MAIPKETLPQLVRLQEQDKIVDALQASIDKIPGDIKALSAMLDAEKAHLADAKAASTKLQLAKKEKELSLSQKEEAIRKHGTELNSVKTNEAYKALQNEIEEAKSDVGDLETAILTVMEEIDQAAKNEKAAAAALKEKEGKLQGEIKVLEGKQAELNAKAAAEKTKRDALIAGIPADAIKLYDYLHKRKQGIAMSPVKGNMCGACRITLPPQSIVDLARGSSLVTCEACQRIIYNPATLEPSAPATPAAAAAPVDPGANPPVPEPAKTEAGQ